MSGSSIRPKRLAEPFRVNVQLSGPRSLPRRDALLRFARKVCKAVPALDRPGEICLAFVSDREIARVNWKFLRHRGATDVISFRYPVQRGVPGPAPFGDIYVSMDTAARQARRGKYPAFQELALLVVHGLLHLAGYEDHTAPRRKRMFARQKVLLRRLAPDLAPPDFR